MVFMIALGDFECRLFEDRLERSEMPRERLGLQFTESLKEVIPDLFRYLIDGVSRNLVLGVREYRYIVVYVADCNLIFSSRYSLYLEGHTNDFFFLIRLSSSCLMK